MFLDAWRLAQAREFKDRRITEQQLLSHYRTIDDMMRDVEGSRNERQYWLNESNLRSFYLEEYEMIFDTIASYVSNLKRQRGLLRANGATVPANGATVPANGATVPANGATVPASEVPSTGDNAAQSPPDRPADYVFDFADIPINSPMDMGAFIVDHPIVMQDSEIEKLRAAAYLAILERGDKEQARNYVRHILVLQYVSHAETVSGLYRLLMAITTDSPNSSPPSRFRLDFERDVEQEMDNIDTAAWNDMHTAVAEAAGWTQSE
ncbi:uncharacterized protein BBA_07625 [Beauveria bassiana ARSEF 2860]|uniref:Cdc37 Hsp90 binding domain-containing protein n=1 Tax=Beauveria bassiana (strain ARSEF 2860) TaxID=655819 RepID=J4KM72_BEAB2|nr:uncharacterized protein BBA_07625 [Beauveria bassiana ARSEF 2860]EJP63449.1 hypothetical protein BBA_07625 [Beauveria bassiana ARSEF 2860]